MHTLGDLSLGSFEYLRSGLSPDKSGQCQGGSARANVMQPPVLASHSGTFERHSRAATFGTVRCYARTKRVANIQDITTSDLQTCHNSINTQKYDVGRRTILQCMDTEHREEIFLCQGFNAEFTSLDTCNGHFRRQHSVYSACDCTSGALALGKEAAVSGATTERVAVQRIHRGMRCQCSKRHMDVGDNDATMCGTLGVQLPA